MIIALFAPRLFSIERYADNGRHDEAIEGMPRRRHVYHALRHAPPPLPRASTGLVGRRISDLRRGFEFWLQAGRSGSQVV